MSSSEKKSRGIWDRKAFLILFSVLASILLWMFVSANYGSIEAKVISDVPISFNTEDIKARYGLELIEIIGPEDLKDRKMDVKIRAKRIVLSQITTDDIVVTAQTGNITTAGSHVLTLKVECKNPLLNVSFDPENSTDIFVKFDRIREKTFEITDVVVEGNIKTEEGYVVEKAYSNVETISLKGPESIIDSISEVNVQTSAEEKLTASKTYPGMLVYYDKNGNQVTSNNISHNFTENITVTVPVKLTKRLKLEISFKNMPAGYSGNMLKYTLSPSEITVKGAPDAINAAFDSDTLIVGEVDFAKLITSNNPIKFPLTFSSGIELMTDETEVLAEFDLSGIRSKVLNITQGTANFKIINNAPSHAASVITQTIKSVTVYGPLSQLKNVRESDITVTIDLADKGSFTGNCVVTALITVANHNKCWVVGTYEVEVSIQNVT